MYLYYHHAVLYWFCILKFVCDVCYRSFFDHHKRNYNDLTKLEVESTYAGLDVDWIYKQIYFCDESRIMEYDMMSGNSSHLYTSTTGSGCQDLAVDPYTRYDSSTSRSSTILTTSPGLNSKSSEQNLIQGGTKNITE